MFSHINKEEMEMSIEHDFATLNAKLELELECSMKKEVAKGQWDGPRSILKCLTYCEATFCPSTSDYMR